MKVIERFTRGKTGNEELNEDRIVETPHFIGVMDGATSREKRTLGGMPNGRFAAEFLAGEIARLPAGISAGEGVVRLQTALKSASEAAAAQEGKSFPEIWAWPAAALLLYSRERREVWRVADSTFLLDGVPNYKTFPQEETWSELRRAYLCSLIARGATEQELLENDNSFSLLTPLIAEFKVFANYGGEYGYGVLNGMPVPERHIEVYDARAAAEIVFASDGYPEVFTTLAQTEEHIARVLSEDPLMYRLYPQVKGVKKGDLSFDDRTYIRFRP